MRQRQRGPPAVGTVCSARSTASLHPGATALALRHRRRRAARPIGAVVAVDCRRCVPLRGLHHRCRLLFAILSPACRHRTLSWRRIDRKRPGKLSPNPMCASALRLGHRRSWPPPARIAGFVIGMDCGAGCMATNPSTPRQQVACHSLSSHTVGTAEQSSAFRYASRRLPTEQAGCTAIPAGPFLPGPRLLHGQSREFRAKALLRVGTLPAMNAAQTNQRSDPHVIVRRNEHRHQRAERPVRRIQQYQRQRREQPDRRLQAGGHQLHRLSDHQQRHRERLRARWSRRPTTSTTCRAPSRKPTIRSVSRSPARDSSPCRNRPAR